jgi:hypothetical protein
VLCLIVVPLPPGENSFAVKYKYISLKTKVFIDPAMRISYPTEKKTIVRSTDGKLYEMIFTTEALDVNSIRILLF